ncbi:flagellar assembly peptidoglycan hydrolase FlgJ [Methyloversatilis discipulorum]|uniref:flagellar assembly peptidoglycan hydrolase FlgJ n=1 Tax=Methyloversatilis discipulorum TaxID=1119528 RepID=UPI001A5F09D9|nr:flagellar assembly peptidoglycan hydrolase FlgJ [Methyloversatilis discipulorum]MBL8468675.1 flagellar assembly peptidoglycan hydrolase FlgJ [Methyloversatilis discipulorum]
MENAALNTLAADVRGLDVLRRAARDNSPEALKAAAKQFEAMFLQVVIKSMREASHGDELFGGQESKMYQDMLDQQWAQVMTEGGGTGLARVLERQLSANANSADTSVTPELRPLSDAGLFQGLPRMPATASSAALRQSLQPGEAAAAADLEAALAELAPARTREVPAHARAFVERVWPAALSASRATGIPAQFLVAQAALETGWGKAELVAADGTPSHNLFNIKAGSSWQGQTVTVSASEFIDGRWTKQTDAFRSYGSYEESFADYARLLQNQPRYARVLGAQDAGSFARGLQQAGYATDPAYADKLERIIKGPLLRAALSG